jgi:hypothetical protein
MLERPISFSGPVTTDSYFVYCMYSPICPHVPSKNLERERAQSKHFNKRITT